MANILFIGIGLAFAAVVQPGPFQAYLISQSLQNGWKRSVPLVFAPLITDGPIILLVLIVLTNIPSLALSILQCLGGLLLFYLAYGAFMNYRRFESLKLSESNQHNLFKAVLVNLFNPSPYIGWSLIMGPILIKCWNHNPIEGIAFLLGFYSTMIVCSIALLVIFSSTRSLGPRVSKISIGVSAVALFGFAIYQVYAGINSFAF